MATYVLIMHIYFCLFIHKLFSQVAIYLHVLCVCCSVSSSKFCITERNEDKTFMKFAENMKLIDSAIMSE